jgi:prophage regulatory protein
MQSRGSNEVHGDLLAAQCRQPDPIEPSAGKSPPFLDQSTTVSSVPATSALGASGSSELHPQAAKSGRFHSAPPVPQGICDAAPASVDPIASGPANHRSNRVAAPKAKRSRTNSAADITGSERFIRRREVQRLTGLSRSSLYRLIAEKDFPPAIQLSTNTVAWLESEVNVWILDRVAVSRKHPVSGKLSTGAR